MYGLNSPPPQVGVGVLQITGPNGSAGFSSHDIAAGPEKANPVKH